MKFPESRMKEQFETTKLNRWHLATYGQLKPGMRTGIFRKMKLEFVILSASILLGLSKIELN